jgi:hypothetical protein
MQDTKENILTSADKFLALKNKIQVWKEHLSSGNIEMFPFLLQIQDQSDCKKVIQLTISHFESLTDSLDQYLPSLPSEMCDWFRNPFVGFSQNSLNMQEEEQFTELQCDHTLKMKFSEVSFAMFWISIRKEYYVISTKAVKILLWFSNSYLCEQGFSCLTNIKSKDRNRPFSVEEEVQYVCQKFG